MGIERNGDRIWNAIGGVMVAGLIITGTVFTANGSMSTISDNFLGFLNKELALRMPGEMPDYTASDHTAAHTGKNGQLGAFTPLSQRPN